MPEFRPKTIIRSRAVNGYETYTLLVYRAAVEDIQEVTKLIDTELSQLN